VLASLVQIDCPTMPEGHQLISVKEKYNKIALMIIKNRNKVKPRAWCKTIVTPYIK